MSKRSKRSSKKENKKEEIKFDFELEPEPEPDLHLVDNVDSVFGVEDRFGNLQGIGIGNTSSLDLDSEVDKLENSKKENKTQNSEQGYDPSSIILEGNIPDTFPDERSSTQYENVQYGDHFPEGEHQLSPEINLSQQDLSQIYDTKDALINGMFLLHKGCLGIVDYSLFSRGITASTGGLTDMLEDEKGNFASSYNAIIEKYSDKMGPLLGPLGLFSLTNVAMIAGYVAKNRRPKDITD